VAQGCPPCGSAGAFGLLGPRAWARSKPVPNIVVIVVGCPNGGPAPLVGTIGQLPFYGEAGFLLVYAAALPAIHRRTAIFVDRILKGAKASELPFESPSQFTLTLNLRRARNLGIDVPTSVLAQAAEVIE
jgi:hypothetical protein